MTTVQVVNVSLPALSEGWSAEKDFKAVGTLSAATQRNLEPVGPHFLAHARRVCTHSIKCGGGVPGGSHDQVLIYRIGANNPLEASPPHFL